MRVYGVLLYLQSVQLCCEPKTGLKKHPKANNKTPLFFSPKQKQSLTFIAHNPANAPLPHTSQITSQNTRLSFYPHFHLQGQSANFAPIAEGPWGYSSTVSIVTMNTMPAYSESRLNDFPSRKDFPAPRDRCGLS